MVVWGSSGSFGLSNSRKVMWIRKCHQVLSTRVNYPADCVFLVDLAQSVTVLQSGDIFGTLLQSPLKF